MHEMEFPFQEGEEAFDKGLGPEDNPYPSGSESYSEWQDGFEGASHAYERRLHEEAQDSEEPDDEERF